MPDDHDSAENSERRTRNYFPPTVRLRDLAALFVRLGASNFGGGNRAWVHREVVERRGWLTEEQFLSGYTIGTILPGSNPVNLALYIGLRLCGGIGAACAVVGMIAPAFALILTSGYFYRQFGAVGPVHFILGGITAAAVGASLSVSVKMARRIPVNAVSVGLAVGSFVAVGILRWPLIPVVLALMPVGIAAAFLRERKRGRDR